MSADRVLALLGEVLPEGIVDAHHHLWALGEGHYPWLQERYAGEAFFLGPYPSLRRDYGVADLRGDCAPLRLAATVHVEAERARDEQVAETRWIDAVRARDGLPGVTVGHVSFLQPDLDAVLTAHRESPAFRGVRSKPVTAAAPGLSVAGEPGSLQDEAWRAGLARLAAHGLSWDLRVPFWHLAEAAEAVAGLPDVPVILNHCGLPLDRSEEGLSAWRRGMARLADLPQVSVKLSEFGLRGGRWDEAGTVRVVAETVALFGDDRVMFASNLPVSRLSADVPRIVSAVLRGLGASDPSRLRRVFSDTARRVYRIAPGPETR
ncbi:amidohydrolase family protein [Methylobacterium sp. JK268]